jgi:hypothetical protein
VSAFGQFGGVEYIEDGHGGVDVAAVQRSLDALRGRLEVLEQAQTTPWVDLPLTAPWVQYDTNPIPNYRARYRKKSGLVLVQGLVRNTVAYSYGAGTNLAIAQLPVGFRPSGILMGEGHELDSNGTFIVLRVDIIGGAITIQANNDWSYRGGTGSNSGTATWVKLTFPAFSPDA